MYRQMLLDIMEWLSETRQVLELLGTWRILFRQFITSNHLDSAVISDTLIQENTSQQGRVLYSNILLVVIKKILPAPALHLTIY